MLIKPVAATALALSLAFCNGFAETISAAPPAVPDQFMIGRQKYLI
jgi:hypothetical protein